MLSGFSLPFKKDKKLSEKLRERITMIPISIIVPMYNVEAYIEECLESLLKQSIDKEIILIDDGSTDHTYEIAQKYQEKNSCITLIHQENSGQSIARNRGVSIAQGEYIFFCDSDDCIDEESLPKLYDLCKKNRLDILMTGWKTQKGSTMEINLPPLDSIPFYVSMTAGEYYKKSIYSWYNVVPGNGLYRLEFLKKIKLTFPEGIQFEDNTYHLKLLLSDLNAIVMQADSTFYTYHISEQSTTTSKPGPKKIYDQMENIKLMNEFINCNVVDLEHKSLAKVAVSSLVFTMTSYYYRVDKKYRKELSRTISPQVLKEAIKYPQTKFQKCKLIAFTYFRPFLNCYEYFHMRKISNV